VGRARADAKSVYDVLFREPDKPADDGEAEVRVEVGCWSHSRRKFWEAVCAKSEVGREGLARIGRMFALEDSWRGQPPDVILARRRQHLRPHMDAFFAWAEGEYERVRDQRGLLRSALGYAVRQKDALTRVLEDGRLILENNKSERALRRIAVGRRGWLFVGSDTHGEAAGHIPPARPRSRGLPARALPCAGPLAEGALPRALAEVLGPDPRPTRRGRTGGRGRPAHHSAAAHAARGGAGGRGLTGQATALPGCSGPRAECAALTRGPPDGVRASHTLSVHYAVRLALLAPNPG